MILHTHVGRFGRRNDVIRGHGEKILPWILRIRLRLHQTALRRVPISHIRAFLEIIVAILVRFHRRQSLPRAVLLSDELPGTIMSDNTVCLPTSTLPLDLSHPWTTVPVHNIHIGVHNGLKV